MSSTERVAGDYYDTLGVSRDASTEEIKKAFRKLARECHPDVAGEAVGASDQFNRVRAAYEVLIDPVRRAQYDRRHQRGSRMGPDGMRMPGGFTFRTGGAAAGSSANRSRYDSKANNLDLEDIFGDFGNVGDFGFGAAPGPTAPPPRGRGASHTPRQSGREISLVVDVPSGTAARGGVVTLNYPRMRRAADGSSLYRYDEIHDLRVPPGTEHGSTLRVPRMGDAANDGTADGDLVCDVRVVSDPTATRQGRSGGPDDAPGGHRTTWQQQGDPQPHTPDERFKERRHARERTPTEQTPPPPGEEAAGDRAAAESRVVPITVSEALLGGRVDLPTVAGKVRVSVPPCTSSGTRLRLRGKGIGGGDLLVELRIVVPRSIDQDSRALIEEFAAMNPYDPRA